MIAGELQESSKKTVERLIDAQVFLLSIGNQSDTTTSSLISMKFGILCTLQDALVEAAKEQANSVSYMISQATK